MSSRPKKSYFSWLLLIKARRVEKNQSPTQRVSHRHTSRITRDSPWGFVDKSRPKTAKQKELKRIQLMWKLQTEINCDKANNSGKKLINRDYARDDQWWWKKIVAIRKELKCVCFFPYILVAFNSKRQSDANFSLSCHRHLSIFVLPQLNSTELRRGASQWIKSDKNKSTPKDSATRKILDKLKFY